MVKRSGDGSNDGHAPEAVLPLREEHRRITQDRLVAAAKLLFRENGFRATTVEQIAKRAGTTASTFYRHFKSKLDLANILQVQLEDEVLAGLRKLEAIPQLNRKTVRAWFNEYYEMWEGHDRLSEAYWEAAAADTGFAAQVLSTTLAMTGRLTRLLERLPTDVRERGHQRLALLVVLADRVAFLVKSLGHDPRRSPIFDEFADIFFAAVFRIEDSA